MVLKVIKGAKTSIVVLLELTWVTFCFHCSFKKWGQSNHVVPLYGFNENTVADSHFLLFGTDYVPVNPRFSIAIFKDVNKGKFSSQVVIFA